jgi:hypothetical protein
MRVIYASSRARHFAIGTPSEIALLNVRLRQRRFHFLRPAQPKPRCPAIAPARRRLGLTRFELVTPRLSSVCSNQLSYRPSDSAKTTSDKPTRSRRTWRLAVTAGRDPRATCPP